MVTSEGRQAKGKRRDAGREARWRKLVAAQSHSGRNVRAYCREHGLVESAFWFWKRELARRDAEEAKGRNSKPKGASRRPAFVPVSLASATSVAPLEVVLTGGVSVRVAAGCEEGTLRMVLEVLESRP